MQHYLLGILIKAKFLGFNSTLLASQNYSTEYDNPVKRLDLGLIRLTNMQLIIDYLTLDPPVPSEAPKASKTSLQSSLKLPAATMSSTPAVLRHEGATSHCCRYDGVYFWV